MGSLVYTFAVARTNFIYAYYICIAVGGTIGALFAICYKKPLAILATSFVGAYESESKTKKKTVHASFLFKKISH